jgi:5-methylcytosine-specific restriction endonuclease McrA
MVDYNQYMRSREWDHIRRQVLDRANGQCEHCGERGLLQVHHLHYESLGNEDLDDLQALCEDCHSDADIERAEETQERMREIRDDWAEERWQARVRGFARAMYGPDWRDHTDEAEERLIDLLDSQGDGGEVPPGCR